MKRLLVDASSVIWRCLLVGRDEETGRVVQHEGKDVYTNGWEYGLENCINSLTMVLNTLGMHPNQVVFVIEGVNSKSRRVALHKDYKAGRGSRPPEAYEAFNAVKEILPKTFADLGSQSVVNDACEADDTIAYLCHALKGEKVVMTEDGDLAVLINDDVSLWRQGALLTECPYGPFPPRFTTVWKATVGDKSDSIPGAKGFGKGAFLDMLVNFGDAGLAALEGLILRRELYKLEEDVAEFKPFRKIIDNAEMVYTSYDVARMYPSWVNTEQYPLQWRAGHLLGSDMIQDERLVKWAGRAGTKLLNAFSWEAEASPMPVGKPDVVKQHAVFDCELIGSETPVFLVCAEIVETGERFSFWHHVDGDMKRLEAALGREDLTWVSFNGINFDAPLISAAIGGKDPKVLKEIANRIIVENAKHWNLPDEFGYSTVDFDHIDLIEVAPGVRISLKAYAGRMGYPTMVDLPFHHDQDLDADEMAVLESYCLNDLGVTKTLFQTLSSEIELRRDMSEQYGIDLRSKSDAQVAEAVLKKAVGISGRVEVSLPAHVMYSAPKFIQTDSDVINGLIDRLQRTQFSINRGNGQVEAPDFLKDPLQVNAGTYQCGVGGLHSTHDKKLHVEAHEEMLVSDFDVASYYPNIMLKAGLTPRMSRGEKFIEEYRKIYERRIEAKRAGDKKVSNALKISLNGTFGKLGSMFSPFYSPDLMLAVTLTGQLNLLCLIHDLEKTLGVSVMSANTDGIMVIYPPHKRQAVLDTIAANAERTGFEYEETRYKTVALSNVNNYLAITTDGKVKRKGLFADKGLMKNPASQVCSNMAVDYLKEGIHPRDAIHRYTDITDFVSIRAVKGGGIQPEAIVDVEEPDDWVEVADREWARPGWYKDGVLTRATVKRKSRPNPVMKSVIVGGTPFGRIARWYMTTEALPPIVYCGSGNKVPKTEGAKVCMTLPSSLPDDLDREWYINETLSMLADMGVEIEGAVAHEPEEETTV